MGQEPDRIRAEIEQTRAEMSETVDALGYKADVKTRAKENLQDKRDSAKESLVGVKDKVVGGTPDADQAKATAKRAGSVAQENPLGLAIGAVAVGFVVGSLLPKTRVEQEKIGPMATQAREQVSDLASEAVEHGKQVAEDTMHAAAETASQSGQHHAEQLRDSAKEAATDR